ncbi:fimbrial protein, putative [Stenotrophomonas sp. SKA14]|nr:fimbrial protein, putative [Stenotrophomonas sp. SKA14]
MTPEYVFKGRNQPLTEWQTDANGRVHTLFSGCSDGQNVDVLVDTYLTEVGSDDGYTTFATNLHWAGVQYRVAIGDKPFLDITSLSSGIRFPVPTGTGRLAIEVQYRYIALTEAPGGGVLQGGAIFGYTGSHDGSGSALVTATIDMLNPYVPPPPPSCSITSYPRSVDLGRLHTSQLRNVGDRGPAHGFSWGYSCNDSVSSAEVRYSADGIIDANAGTFAVTGGAKGIGLEVRRGVNGSSEGTPVKFNSPYRLGTRNVTERMSVRYVRTGEVTAGDANGSLKIRLDYY